MNGKCQEWNGGLKNIGMFNNNKKMNLKIKEYQKHNSFHEFHVTNGQTDIDEQIRRSIKILEEESNIQENWKQVLLQVKNDLKLENKTNTHLNISPFVADEMQCIIDKEIPKYLYHRYRYEIYPKIKRLDEFPPYLQIEPSSICNYRCTFCYQTDQSFSKKKSEHMGVMSIDLFKKIIDQIEGKIEFISMASRGEPLICKDFDKMMEYSIGKFLNLKVNTNASLLTEKMCHALLCGGAKTIVFSADAAEENLYSKLRVRGKLKNVLKNIERFKNIREREYKNFPLITRVSGVYVDNEQNMSDMKNLWGELVDQVCFVKYHPLENIYESPFSNIDEPCSELWRRMFIWQDGSVNPCESDFKSNLKVGNIDQEDLTQIWLGDKYKLLRNEHIRQKRNEIHPCNRCVYL